ncbi:MAG: hypothetical protein EBR02_02515 [Alphaproteobacteria bacterium]|nr:hypothetical protein [Alphaproteobacteria bacterium]
MFAVIRTGGKQYKVASGDVLSVEKLEGNVGDKVEINDVLMTGATLGGKGVLAGHQRRPRPRPHDFRHDRRSRRIPSKSGSHGHLRCCGRCISTHRIHKKGGQHLLPFFYLRQKK